MNNKFPQFFQKQRGAALLVFFLFIFSIASTVLFAALNNRPPSLLKKENIHHEMVLAKEALLAYAFNYSELFPATNNGPGRLPCTDSTNNGIEDCFTSGARLPESLIIESGDPFQLVNNYAGIDQQLWYFISPAFAKNSATQLNSTTSSPFTLDSQNEIIAVLVAPGDAFSTQDRVSNPISSLNYLEGSNQSGSNFTNSNPGDPDNFNDQVLGITRSELMSLVAVKVAIELKIIFDEFHLNYTAFPIDVSEINEALTGDLIPPLGTIPSGSPTIPAWFYNDAWDLVTTYGYDSDPDIIHYSFANCAITFTLNYGSDLEINPKRC